jgi:hypothetical protein
MRASLLLPCAAVALWSSPARADDQGLQAALLRLKCVPAQVKTTKLSPTVAAYEVTCKGAPQAVTIVCVQDDCRIQRARPEDEP